jgi:hypothetical protein
MSERMPPAGAFAGAQMEAEEALLAFQLCGELIARPDHADLAAAAVIVALCLRNSRSIDTVPPSSQVTLASSYVRASHAARCLVTEDVDVAVAGLMASSRTGGAEALVLCWVSAAQRSLAKVGQCGGLDSFFDSLMRVCLRQLVSVSVAWDVCVTSGSGDLDADNKVRRAWLAAGVTRVQRAVREARAVTFLSRTGS